MITEKKMIKTKLIYALPGLGKTTLINYYPKEIYDTDLTLKNVLANQPNNEINSPPKWKKFVQTGDWKLDLKKLSLWSSIRKKMISEITSVIKQNYFKIVLTNLIHLPYPYTAYFGIKLNNYSSHLKITKKDNLSFISEIDNNILEGYYPLYRLRPGEFIAEHKIIKGLLNIY